MSTINKIREFFRNNGGNVTVTAALSFIPIMMSVGAAIDYTRSANLHNNVARATDAALLAAVADVMQNVDVENPSQVTQRLNQKFEPFFLANMYNAEPYEYNGYQINYDPDTQNVSVTVDVDYEAAVTPVMGIEGWPAGVTAAAKMRMKAGGAVSMYLVLDRSGSMGWWNGENGSKMDSLQNAVGDMVTSLKEADPEKKFIRMGAVAYSHYMFNQQKISWNLDKTNTYVQNMYASGGTDSSDAMNQAYNQLKKNKEVKEHQKKNEQEPKKIIVFMTDGSNNYSSADTATINTCNKAKTNGMEIYTVAFRAPYYGEQLLRNCASSTGHYFEPQNNDQMIAVFKQIGAKVAESLVLSQ